MTHIDVESAGPDSYTVTVHEAATSHHRVTVPGDRFAAGLPETVGPEELVRESFRFLLEREPNTAILTEFDLTDIARYFPEYPEEIGRRVGPS